MDDWEAELARLEAKRVASLEKIERMERAVDEEMALFGAFNNALSAWYDQTKP